MLPVNPFLKLFCICFVVALASASQIIFYDSFDTTWEGRWTASDKNDYQGTWKHSKSEGHEDFGILVNEKAKKYGLVTELAEKVDFTVEAPVVLQYDVRFQQGLECGGAYLKFLSNQPSGWSPKQFDNESPYSIMFGPDKCGATNKVHFIFRHNNPKTGQVIEHHLKYPPTPAMDKLSHVYTAVVYPNNSVSILIDGVAKKTADLLSSDFGPPVIPPKTIPDPEDKKPEDWDEKPTNPDPAATKPDDWDEDAPLEIEDTEAVKPDGWLDDEPAEIDDPEAVKPQEWDDEEDGEWEPVKIPNPKCAEAPGCGEWTRPTIRNPKYVGKWSPPSITNPNYKGLWKPREIPNPDFFELEKVNLDPISAVGIEIWTMQDGILFDNVLIARDEAVAKDYRDKTWKVKYEVEKINQKEDEEDSDEESSKSTQRLTVLQSHAFNVLRRIAEFPFLGAYKEKLTGLIEKAETKPNLMLSIAGGLIIVFLTSIFKVLSGKNAGKYVSGKDGKGTSTSAPEQEKSIKSATLEKGKENKIAENGEKSEEETIKVSNDDEIEEAQKEETDARHRKTRRENKDE